MTTPQALILFRFLLAPIILALAYFVGESSKMTILVLMYLGLLINLKLQIWTNEIPST